MIALDTQSVSIHKSFPTESTHNDSHHTLLLSQYRPLPAMETVFSWDRSGFRWWFTAGAGWVSYCWFCCWPALSGYARDGHSTSAPSGRSRARPSLRTPASLLQQPRSGAGVQSHRYEGFIDYIDRMTKLE